MITIQLTAEYDPETDELEVLLPEGIDPKKLTFSRREPTAQAQTTPDASSEANRDETSSEPMSTAEMREEPEED